MLIFFTSSLIELDEEELADRALQLGKHKEKDIKKRNQRHRRAKGMYKMGFF